MSRSQHRESSPLLRVIPKLPRQSAANGTPPSWVEDNQPTQIDAKPVMSQALPALRGAQSTASPQNIIPFTKPRAISKLAADDPKAVVITPVGKPLTTPATLSGVAETRVHTGWTPPQGVKSLAPASGKVAAPITAFPASAPAIPLPMQQPLLPHPEPGVAESPIADPAAPAPRWAEYEALGLGAPKQAPATTFTQRFGKWIVSGYRLLGFTILTIIVFVLVGYIAQTAFFYVSDSWVVPSAVSETDERVVTLQAQLAEQQNARDRIADELNQAERAIVAQQTFQGEFAKAIKNDLGGRKAALGRVRALANAAASTRASIKSQNAAYASAARRRMAEEYAAGLIDRSAMLSGKFQLAQISSSNLSLAERQAEFETRASELESQTRSLEAIIEIEGETTSEEEVALSYEVLRIKQEYEASKLDLAKSVEARDTLKAALDRQDKIVTSLQQSAYLRAIADGASVAFVPYGNLSSVAKGTPLYACKLGMVFCYHVGEVLEVLPGEVQFKHPQRDKQLRGQLVELKLDQEDADAATDDVLFAGGKPLLL
jgi:hypothetical protein